jgi:hypothetical protein
MSLVNHPSHILKLFLKNTHTHTHTHTYIYLNASKVYMIECIGLSHVISEPSITHLETFLKEVG